MTKQGKPKPEAASALDAASLDFVGPAEIDEVYLSAAKQGRERDRQSGARGLLTRGRDSDRGDSPPVFIIADRLSPNVAWSARENGGFACTGEHD
jgi:hypothetical protein